MELKNAKVVITGGSKGLGFSIAQELLTKGSIVHIIARDNIGLKEAKQKLNNQNLFIHQADITSIEDQQKLLSEIKDIDILINNAGIWLEGDLTTNSYEQIAKVVDVNLKGLIFTTRTFLPILKTKINGFILNISSTTGIKTKANQIVYSSSKFGVHGFTEALKEDLKETNIKVAGFYPGGMNTDISAHAGFPIDSSDWMDTKKIAKIIAFILEQDDTMVIDQIVINKRKTKVSH